MDNFGKLLEYGTNWILDGARRGDWGQVAVGVLFAAFAIGVIVYAIRVLGSAFKSGSRGVDLLAWELFDAARRGDKREVLAQLNKNKGADINKQDKDGLTPLMYACSVGTAHDDVVQLLVDRGADLNLRDKDSGTALMHAAIEGHVTTARILIDSGSDIDATTKDGVTVLKIAYDKERPEIIELLEKAATTKKDRVNLNSVQRSVSGEKHEKDY
ncbi:ankyrin repeat domain-containing protein, partial [Candidatus Bathyarchaeota archaeon]|nr:ankyrin repeat domain-containing protein [Candidatus Bathyarchaeota archaeon]